MLGWDTFDPQRFVPEYTVGSGRVDFALCHPATTPCIFIEVKRAGSADGEQQLFRYAFERGVPLLVLTNGQTWSFYLPSGQGTFEDRRLYQLDLLERSISDTQNALNKYLAFDRVESGVAIRDAERDARERTQRKASRNEIPLAWNELLQEGDPDLYQILAERVARRCGTTPSTDDVEQFFASLALGSWPRQLPTPVKEIESNDRRLASAEPTLRSQPRTMCHYVLRGRRFEDKHAIVVYINLLRTLAEADATFLERFATRASTLTRSRSPISRDKAALYPGRDDLAENCSEQIGDGWWVGTNYNRASMLRFCRTAGEVAGLAWGTDLIVEMP
jgi:predicted type IV restriction endonuclease